MTAGHPLIVAGLPGMAAGAPAGSKNRWRMNLVAADASRRLALPAQGVRLAPLGGYGSGGRENGSGESPSPDSVARNAVNLFISLFPARMEAKPGRGGKSKELPKRQSADPPPECQQEMETAASAVPTPLHLFTRKASLPASHNSAASEPPAKVRDCSGVSDRRNPGRARPLGAPHYHSGQPSGPALPFRTQRTLQILCKNLAYPQQQPAHDAAAGDRPDPGARETFPPRQSGAGHS